MSLAKSVWESITSPFRSLTTSQTVDKQQRAETPGPPTKKIHFGTPETPSRIRRWSSTLSPALRTRRRMSENNVPGWNANPTTSDERPFRPISELSSLKTSSDGNPPKTGIKNSATMPSMSTPTPSGSGKKLVKKLSSLNLKALNGGSSSRSPSRTGTPTRVRMSDSSTSSKTPSTPTVSKLSKSPSSASTSYPSSPSSPTHKKHKLLHKLGGLFFDPAAKVSNQERPPVAARSKSPPVLLSVVPSEDQFDPKAPPPKHYTVPELLNTMIKHNIELAVDDPPPASSNASVTCTRRSGSTLADSPVASVIEVDSSPTREYTRKTSKGSSTHISRYTPTKQIMIEPERSDIDDLLRKAKNDPVLRHQPWLQQIANPDVQKRDPAKYAYTHPDGTPFTYEEEMNELMNPKPRRKILDILADKSEEAGIPPISRGEAAADYEDIMKTLKIPDLQDMIYQEHDWANEDWQARSQDQASVARERALALERVQAVREKHAKQRAERAQRQYEERDKELAAVEKKREMYQRKYLKRKEKKAALRDPSGWFEGKTTAENFPRFLEMPQQAMTVFMRTVLKVPGEELVPYHYVAGKVIKNPDGTRRGLRKKPQMEVLVALNATHHKSVRKALDAARNVLYRENKFAFRKPVEMIMFMNAIGWTNITRMKFAKNLVVSSTFFRHKQSLELKWLVRWHPELRGAMKGFNLITPEWKPEDIDEDYEPPEVEKALKAIVEVIEESDQLDAKIAQDNHGTIPSRIQTLDLGESFDSISSCIQSMGLDDANKIEAAESDGNDDTEEIQIKNTQRDGKEEATTSLLSKIDHAVDEWGEWFWDAASYEPKTDEMIARDEDEDATSEESGYFSPALYDDDGEAESSGQAEDNASISETCSISSTNCSKLEREVDYLFETHAGPSQ